MSAPDTLDLTPEPDAVAAAMAWLETLAERDGWPPRLALAMTLSTDEALTNVLLYAFAGRDPAAPPPRIRLECERLDDGVRVTLVDNGVAFDPTTIAEPKAMTSVEEASIGGHGLQLMRHYLRTLRYARVGDENRLALEAEWPAPTRP